MRLITADILAEWQKENYRTFSMVEFDFNTIYRFNDTEDSIYDENSALFVPRTFTFDNINASAGMAVAQIDIVIDNTDQIISAILLNEDVRNNTVKLYVGVVAETEILTPVIGGDTLTLTTESGDTLTTEAGDTLITEGTEVTSYTRAIQTAIHTQEYMRGFVSSWELSSDNKAIISIKNEFVLWQKKALRIQQSSCPWPFRGLECGYSGSEMVCNKTFGKCLALGNNNNFGGFRFLPSIMEKEIWWGRNQTL